MSTLKGLTIKENEGHYQKLRFPRFFVFQGRDVHQPTVTFENRLQLTLIELKKADRLARRAQRDERSLLKDAREEGRQEGEQIGLQKGEQIGWQKAARATASHLIGLGLLNDVQIAQATGLSLAQVEALRASATP